MDLHEKIARVAYELYEKSGKIGGRDLENWIEAERIVRNTTSNELQYTPTPKSDRRRGHRRKI